MLTVMFILGLILSIGSGIYLTLRVIRAERALEDYMATASGWWRTMMVQEGQIANIRRELAEKRGRISDIHEPFWDADSEPSVAAGESFGRAMIRRSE